MPLILPNVYRGSIKSNPKMNVFTGITKPSTYEGIYIETETEIANIIEDNDVWEDHSLQTPGSLSNCPIKTNKIFIYENSVCAVGDNIMYKYNESTNTWTGRAFTTISNSYYRVIGDYIYLCSISSTTSSYTMYTYNIYRRLLTDTAWTQMGNGISYRDGSVSDVIMGDEYCYILHAYYSSTSTNYTGVTYRKYTDTAWTKIDTLTESSFSKGISIGDILYIGGLRYGSSSSYYQFYKYDPSNGTLTKLANHTATVYFRLFNLNDNIGFMYTYNYGLRLNEYTISNNTWISNSGISPENASKYGIKMTHHFSIIQKDDYLYILIENYFHRYNLKQKPIPKGTIIFQRPNIPYGTYYTVLSSIDNLNYRLITGFNDVLFSDTDGVYPTKPIYYGNGTEWIKIKG